MSADEQENNCESICQYVHTHNSIDPEINILCQKWVKLCEELNIDLHYVRSKMDDWFVEVYKSRDHLNEKVEDTGMTKKNGLYWQFFKDFEKVINEETDILKRIQMGAARDKIKEQFGRRIDGWVDLAVQCVYAEAELFNNYSTVRMQSVQIQKAIQKIENDISNAAQRQMAINEGLKTFQNNVSTLRDLYERKEETEQHFRNYQDHQVVRQALQRQNGNIQDQEYFKSRLDNIGRDINSYQAQLQLSQQQVSQMFGELYDVLDDLVDNLKKKVKEWQREFQLNYAEMVASPDLDTVAPWCARTGQIVHEVLHGSIVKWQNILSDVPDANELPDGDCQTHTHKFQTIMTDFIRSTFVVTEQGNFFIKTGNKRFPKFCVRVLAADNFSKHSEETTAHFVSEDDLKQCWLGPVHGLDLNLKRLEKCEKKLKSNKIKFSTETGKDKMECCFQNLQFAQSFKRSNKEINKQVHEEKYRVVFVTKMESATCWTMSLPLVVTTASNQEAHSLASIMWQCYSTNVFSPSSDIPEELPWSDVGEMLQMKMARLSTQHRLSPENIKHLRDRLFGDENTPDDAPVSLTQFCWNYMQDTEFSFWKWFLGVYNLIEQYLYQFWADGLIMGFVKKETAEQMLERCDRAGTFILRFSDKHFTNSDGRKSVYGRLTSCVIVMKEVKGNKRNSSSQLEPIKRKVVEHVDVADFKKLGGELKKQETDDGSKNNLANILKETWIKGRDNQVQMYRYLYPSGKPREELFDKYCEEGSTVSGYRHTREAYIAILEQAMTKVSLSKPECASVSSLGSDMSVQFGAVCTKKPRRSRDNADKIKRSPRRSSSCQSNISSPQGSPYPAQSPQSHSQSPFHATQSPGPPPISPVYPTQSPYPMSSPAQSVPSPAFSFHQQTSQNVDSMVPSSDEKSLLPTFITEGFPVSSTSSHIESQTSRILNKTLPSDNFQTAASVAVSGFDAMEISSEMSENQSFASELFSPEATLVTDSISTSTEWEVLPKREDNVTLTEVMPMGGTVLSKEGGNMSFSGNHMRGIQVMSQGGESMTAAESGFCETGENTEVVFIVTQNNGQFGLNIGESKEQQPNITSTMSSRPVPELANYQILGLTQAQFQQVQTWVEENRIAAETVLQNTQSRAVDTGIGDTPVSTSSGSSSGLFEYSANQLAAMGSGDIDPNFASSIVGQDSQDGN